MTVVDIAGFRRDNPARRRQPFETDVTRDFLLAVPILAVCSAWVPAASGHEAAAGDVAIAHPWARASLSVKARNGAAYLAMRNSGSRTERLTGASTHVADRAELHAHETEGDVIGMRRVEAIEIPAGGTVELAPGGPHVMLMGLRTPLVKGMTFPLTLVFELAGEVDVDVVIEAAAARRGETGHGGRAEQDAGH